MKRWPLKLVLPLAIILTSGVVALFLVTAGARVQTRPAEDFARLVRAAAVDPQPRRLAVRAQGSVEPRTQTDLVAETAGRIIEVSPSFAAGGFFDEGELLIRLDATDQEIAQAYDMAKAENDPEKVADMGEEIRTLAARRLADIERAYQQLTGEE